MIKGNEFPYSKKAFKALLHTLKQNGKAFVKKHPPVTKPDMDRIQSKESLMFKPQVACKIKYLLIP